MKLPVATCQFPVDADIRKNCDCVRDQMHEAHRRGAQVAHFSEGCLSGYAGVEFRSFADFDWDLLESSTIEIMALARRLRLWVILGSSHRLSNGHKPHNSLYVIDDRGGIVDRYDKMFCTGAHDERTEDLKNYSPGDHLVTCEIRGVRCGLLICHDFRYQELYREYKRLGAQLIFHSYHNGHSTKAKLQKHGNIWGVIVPPTMQTYAANNHLWISANNTTRRESSWPSFFVRPDGVITGRLPSHRPGILISTVDTKAKFYDASAAWRERAMRGVYHSGTLVRDPRSKRRSVL
ncbi:MAG: carbon-nitrogen hydrolase family protein [Acidobacteria bacterium]|nr:MAG: carbon-nitrogen hydrolase family protein [Acidobacteriota bacterium]